MKFSIKSIVFATSLRVELSANAIFVAVGPNNSGKSALLNALKSILSGQHPRPSALETVEVLKPSILEARDALAQYQAPNGLYKLPGIGGFWDANISSWLDDKSPAIGEHFAAVAISDLATRARLSDCDPPASFDARKEDPKHPFQKLYADDGKEAEASAIVKRAFKLDLILHRGAGNVIPAYVGDKPKLKKKEDRVSRSYLDKLESLAKLEEQGDGLRSFVSIIARTLTEARPIQLIDEPEAFLHPPQARLIAEHIVAESSSRQTSMATHSSDILRGLLSKDVSRIHVVRLSRTPQGANVRYLEPEKISALWRDPILRFSNVLDGLFHEGVIVTEADADCRFYETIADTLIPQDSRPDIHYTYSGGKDRLPTLISALSALGVPVATVVDFDILNNERPLRLIVEAYDGEWDRYADDWKQVVAGVTSGTAFVGGDKFKQSVDEQLKNIPGKSAVPTDILKSIRQLTRNASPWDVVKRSGLAALPSGNCSTAAIRLLKNLKQIGIFVVPTGEMEGFCRSVGGHGPRWVESALQKDLAHDPELSEARKFVSELFSFFPASRTDQRPARRS